jgi:hypothetical protein
MTTPKSTYDPTKTFLVEKRGTNVLVRGNMPLKSDSSFAYNELNTRLKELVGGNFDLKNNKLVDLSLIDNNPASERYELQSEFEAYGMSKEDFDKNFAFPDTWPPVYRKVDVTKQWETTVDGDKGSIIWYPCEGCSSDDNCKLVEPPQYDFNGLVEMVDDIMTTQENTVVYFHCMLGHDRTSALHAGYLMRYMGTTLESALNDAPPKGAKGFGDSWLKDYEELVKYYAGVLGKDNGEA